MADATTAAAKADPSQHFAIVDNNGNRRTSRACCSTPPRPASRRGYLAAGYSKTGKVATYGGMNFASVTVYMDGFYEGVQYYNTKKHKSVQVLGWNEKTQKGSLRRLVHRPDQGLAVGQNFIQAGADVIYPVAGGTGLGTAAAAKASGKASVIWVDTDGCISAAQDGSVFLTTTFKGIATAVKSAVEDGSAGHLQLDRLRRHADQRWHRPLAVPRLRQQDADRPCSPRSRP